VGRMITKEEIKIREVIITAGITTGEMTKRGIIIVGRMIVTEELIVGEMVRTKKVIIIVGRMVMTEELIIGEIIIGVTMIRVTTTGEIITPE
jgi:hypothetical protein